MDGNQDVLFSTDNSSIFLWYGDGAADFQDSGAIFEGMIDSPIVSIQAHDLNGDNMVSLSFYLTYNESLTL